MSFERTLGSANVHLQESSTRDWINAASQRVLDRSSATAVLHLKGQCKCNSRAELVFRSVAEGFCTLIFAEWAGRDKCAWKIATGGSAADPTAYAIPESFRMDANRLWKYS
jgi:hypothetical protein